MALKLEIIRNEDKIEVYVSARDTSDNSVDELTDAYAILMSNWPRDGGYIDGQQFKIVVLDKS